MHTTPSSVLNDSQRHRSAMARLQHSASPTSKDLNVVTRMACALALTAAVTTTAACGTTESSESTDPKPAPAPVAAPEETAAAPEAPPEDTGPTLADWESRLARYARPALTVDVSKLPASEQEALQELVKAAKFLDPIYDRQTWAGNPALLEELAKDTSPEGIAKLRYTRTHRGPWDRQEHHAPFAVDVKRPDGAGFYPEDLTADEFKAYIEAHPDQKDALMSLTSVVVRDGESLKAIPYREAYKEWLVPAAKHLEEAAKKTKNKSLAKFLKSRAKAFLDDDYYQSDKDWMDLDSPVEVTIGPYEVYEDSLMGLKASYETFVTVADPVASKELQKFKALLPAMEENLPVDKSVKSKRGRESPIRVVDLVYTSGDARASVQTIAFNLPNDERVRKEKGAKKVMLRNAIETKFETIMRPIAAQVMHADDQQYLSAKAFFYEVLFHELSHSLGPAFVENNEKKGDVRLALENLYSAIEEAKADVMGAYNILFLIKKKELPASFKNELLVSYFAGLFRSVRFGVSEAHGRGAAMQINKLLEAGGAVYDVEAATFKVDLVKLEAAITELVKELVMIQHRGDKAAATTLLDTYGVVSPPMAAALGKLGGIPVDIRPYFPVAGETLESAP